MVFVIILTCLFLINSLPYYSPAIKQSGLTVMQRDDDTIRIAYIGDSWADGHKEVKCVIDSLRVGYIHFSPQPSSSQHIPKTSREPGN